MNIEEMIEGLNPGGNKIIYKNDAIRVAKEYARQMCRKQNKLVANELVTWTEDLSLPNQKRIHEICEGVEPATDKDGETTGEDSIWLQKDSTTIKEKQQ